MGNEFLSANGSLGYGGAVFRTSSGTVVAVVYNTSSGGIAVYKDIDGTASLVGSAQTDVTVHGTGATIAAIDACIDSSDVIHVLSVADNTGYTRDVAYNTLSGIDGTPSWGTWEGVTTLNGEPTYPSCVIDVDSNDYPRAIWTDEYFYKGSYYSGPYYSHDVGSGWITKERVDTTDQHCQAVYGMAVDTAGDIEVVYESGNTVYHRRRNGSWGTRSSLTNGTRTVKGSVHIDGTTVYRYAQTPGTNAYENDSAVGADPESTGTTQKHTSAGLSSDGERFVIYKDDTDAYLDMVTNSGSGWSSPETLEESTIAQCVCAKGYVLNAGNGVLDYIYSVSDALYYGVYGEGTTDALTANDLDAAAPVLGGPTIGQKHVLDANDLDAAAPVLDSPTLGTSGEDALTANDLDAAAPVLDSPTIGQTHVLDANDLDASAPVLDSPTLAEVGSGGMPVQMDHYARLRRT